MNIHCRPFRSIEALHESQLEVYRCMFHREIAIFAAQVYCAQYELEVPLWLKKEGAAVSFAMLTGKKSGKRGRCAGWVNRYRQDMADYARWDQVNVVREKQIELKEEVADLRATPDIPNELVVDRERHLDWVGGSLERAFECASMLLQGMPGHAGPDAVKASYFRVQENGGDGRFRYHLLPPNLLHALGIEWQVGPRLRPGTKFVPLYDLTL